MAVLIAHFVIDSLLLVMIEAGAFSCFKKFSFRKAPPRNVSIDLDEDVQTEEIRV